MLLKTPLYDDHVKLGAKIVEFSGWEMPVQYTAVIDEHNNVRTNAGIFDTCHMSEFLIEGKDAFAFLQKVTTKDLNKLAKNKCMYSVMCNEKGGVVDDLFIYKFGDNRYMVVANAGTIEKDYKHLLSLKSGFVVTITNISDSMAKLDIQGPKALDIMNNFFRQNFSSLQRFEFQEFILDMTYYLISKSGYTGEDGFEIYFDHKKASYVWNRLLEIGKPYNLKPAGLGARDTLRLECCYSLYGHELSDQINPIEGGVSFVVSMDKDFIGKRILSKMKQKRSSVAFELTERGVPRDHYLVFKDGREIGYVTSGTMSPTLKKGIGMALIKTEFSEIGTEIEINIRDKLYKAKIVNKPFYSYKGR